MPELPEVETVKKGLDRLVTGKTISSVEVLWPRIIEAPETSKFQILLADQTICKMKRRAKYIIFEFAEFSMISHLRMEGKYEVVDSEIPFSKHTHVVFHLTNGQDLRYLDVRKFGRMALVANDKVAAYFIKRKLGPEPTPEAFLLDDFSQQLKKHHQAIKPLLLTQKLVVGLGNIYVDESLFASRIHPEQPADSLTKKQVVGLHQVIMDVLANAVEAGGTTIRTYQNALGEAGKFQVALKVYGQTGEPCPKCGTPIQKIKVAQRGTHFCPKCQKLKIK